MKKHKSVRRKKSPPFQQALKAAKHDLAAKIVRRAGLMSELTRLNRDIPNLERTVKALQEQLHLHGGGMADAAPRSGSGEPASRRVSRGVEGPAPTVGSSPTHATSDEYPIPPEVLATLPPDALKPVPEMGDEFLPPITGDENILPKKK